MVKVSVVVPVYNTEKYVADCLDSLVNQTLQDIEIICINDGSKDNSAKIIEEYACHDKRIKIISQENQGVSASRNNGMNIAKGDFISFIDSDDWVDKDYLEILYHAAINNDSDIAAATIIRKRKLSQKYRVHYDKEQVYTSLKDKISICNIPVCCYIWNKLYRAEKIRNYQFQEGVFFEDVLWIPEVLKNTNRLVTVPNTNYYYRVNNSSIVKSKQSIKKQCDMYNAKKYIVKFFDENNLDLSDKNRTLTKRIKYIFNIPVLRIKEHNKSETFYLFNLIPILRKHIKNLNS